MVLYGDIYRITRPALHICHRRSCSYSFHYLFMIHNADNYQIIHISLMSENIFLLCIIIIIIIIINININIIIIIKSDVWFISNCLWLYNGTMVYRMFFIIHIMSYSKDGWGKIRTSHVSVAVCRIWLRLYVLSVYLQGFQESWSAYQQNTSNRSNTGYNSLYVLVNCDIEYVLVQNDLRPNNLIIDWQKIQLPHIS